ncbi:ankyrin repeat domain-containing protein [Sphingobacterium cellulitidis]|uniref:Ankyrin n=1 Tax=Sphingobacterium cellulitidis TaxID=1768011 RepID=A0A8H9KV85_9SPHI|nr:ankyrin repeat domain-containing protein [Sphingobacterium soli]MBA8988045.1 ankyrin repeat protein [Sphingobacterium soli]GGE28990.1 hypothetical protein GCM10011516_28410 [Sphingobacterium soli]
MFEKTPLIVAISNGDMENATKLYEQGERIPPSPHSYDYSQLYDTIIRKNGFELIGLMSENKEIEKDIYMLEKLDDTIFSKLIKVKSPKEDFIEFFKDFIGSSDNINDEVSGETLLSHAINNAADPAIIQALIDSGCRVDFKNQAEDNLINLSIKKHGLNPQNLAKYLEIFANEGLDINETNKQGKTALHIALESNKPHALEALLQNGANPNQQDNEGQSAFFIAVAQKADLEQYSKLAEYDSMDFEQTNNRGVKALHEYLRTLEGYNADNPGLLMRMIEDGADLNSTSLYYDNELSAWNWIAQKNAGLFEKVFNATQPEVNEQDDFGNTLLHLVVMKDSNNDQNQAKETYKKVKFLLDSGASPSIVNNQEQSAMMLASQDNLKAKTVEILLIAQQKEN